jgi:nitrogen regulatory protein PII
MRGETHYRLVAIVKPFRLDAVIEALKGLEVDDLQVEEVRGYGRQKGHLELYSGTEYTISFLPKVRLEMRCAPGSLDAAVAAIEEAARTGRIGDGKIFVLEGEGHAAPAEIS